LYFKIVVFRRKISNTYVNRQRYLTAIFFKFICTHTYINCARSTKYIYKSLRVHYPFYYYKIQFITFINLISILSIVLFNMKYFIILCLFKRMKLFIIFTYEELKNQPIEFKYKMWLHKWLNLKIPFWDFLGLLVERTL